MTGPEHYRAADKVMAQDFASDYEIARAQVHATLALAAAVAELDTHEGPGGGSATGRFGAQSEAWAHVGAVVLP